MGGLGNECDLNNLKIIKITGGWTEITSWTDKQAFNPTREIIMLKFESDAEDPFQNTAVLPDPEFSLRILQMKLHNNDDQFNNQNEQEELGSFDIRIKVTAAKVTKTNEIFLLGNQNIGETRTCNEYDAFLSITDQGRLPRELLVDLLGDPIFIAEGNVLGDCSANSPEWSNLINSGDVKFINAVFNEYNGDKIELMGWRSYWKIAAKTGLRWA